MLDLVTFEARTAMARIQTGADAKVYRPIVERSTAALQRDLAFAGSMFDAYRGSDKARIFTAKIAGASIELARLQRFIDGRQNNQDLRQRFAAVETSINSLRAAIHLGPLSELEVTTSNAQEHTKDSERASISTARDALDAGLKHLEEEIELGANRFFQFARLEDPPNAGSMWMELGKSLLVALLGNLAGVGIGKFLRGLAGADVATKIEPETLNRVPSDPRDHIGDAGEGLTSGIGSDTAQSWAGVIDEASTKADSKAEKIKDAVFFQESLLGGRRAIAAGVKLEVSRRTRDKNISAGEISALAVEAERQAVTAKERTYTSASRDFALFLAHRGLGVENRGGVDVSKIGGSQEYFFGTSLQRGGKREETDGIGRLTVQLDRMQPEIKNFEVAGMNSEVAKAILDGANRRVGRLGIPLEIELILPWSRSRPIIVVDERGHVRTSLFANELATSAPDHPVARSFATPEAAWASLKDSFIPEGVG